MDGWMQISDRRKNGIDDLVRSRAGVGARRRVGVAGLEQVDDKVGCPRARVRDRKTWRVQILTDDDDAVEVLPGLCLGQPLRHVLQRWVFV